MLADRRDSQVRRVAFDYLEELSRKFGDVLPFRALSGGFIWESVRVPLLGPQGIFKPKVLDLPLSITTAPDSPYNDAFSADGLLHYKYRGKDPLHRDNVGLRELMHQRKPLIYLHGLRPGRYVAAWPVFIVSDNPSALTVTVAVDDKYSFSVTDTDVVRDDAIDIRRQYLTAAVRIRLHQRSFRERVLRAYRDQCALCRLRHVELLEAAHITPDSEPEGEPLISNGLALCTLHHAAFDRNILGIRPDHVVQIRMDVLHEHDGPMLKHGLQEMHGRKIYVPKRVDQQPNKAALERRYERFLAA